MDPRLESMLEKSSKLMGSALDSKEFAEKMDSSDQLHHLRYHFNYPKMKDLPHVDLSLVDPEEDSIYLCGNSLGLCPKSCQEVVSRQIDKWSKWGVYGHTEGEMPWATGDLCVDEQMAKIVGASCREEVAMMNGLTVNCHLLLLSFYKPTSNRHKIILESKAFPSDHYVVESQIRLNGFDPRDSMICIQPKPGVETLDEDDIFKCLDEHGETTAVLFLSGVQYYTGQVFNMEKITKYAQNKGITVGFDLAHAVGNIPLQLTDWNVDFAAWCTYKYLNSGAGGIAGVFIHKQHHDTIKPQLLGWWGHKGETRFRMDNKMDLIAGPQGFRLTNPSVLLCAALKSSLDVYDMTTLEDLRQKSISLTAYLEYLIRINFSKPSDPSDKPYIDIFTPSSAEDRGCQLSLCFSIPINKIFNELTKRGVACDERHPSVIRVAAVHLYNSYTDIFRFIQTLKFIFLHLSESP